MPPTMSTRARTVRSKTASSVPSVGRRRPGPTVAAAAAAIWACFAGPTKPAARPGGRHCCIFAAAAGRCAARGAGLSCP